MVLSLKGDLNSMYDDVTMRHVGCFHEIHEMYISMMPRWSYEADRDIPPNKYIIGCESLGLLNDMCYRLVV
jgi:hypothetical protein